MKNSKAEIRKEMKEEYKAICEVYSKKLNQHYAELEAAGVSLGRDGDDYLQQIHRAFVEEYHQWGEKYKKLLAEAED